MKVTANKEIRNLIEGNNLRYWWVALHMGICEVTFTRWLRTEMSKERKAKTIKAINELIAEIAEEEKANESEEE